MKRGNDMSWKNRGGVNRLIAILLGLTALLTLSLAIPALLRYQERAQEIACNIARNKAQSMVAIESMFRDWDFSVQEAAAVVDKTRYQRDRLCPAGGDYFIVWQDEPDSRYADTHYKVVCGLHDEDLKERTRLCSGAAFSRLLKELESRREIPDSVKITLNGKPLDCRRVDKNPGLKYGTDSDIDRKGTVCYFGLMGDDESRAALEESEKADFSAVKEGELWYFGYADKNYASVWGYGKGWSGDAWTK